MSLHVPVFAGKKFSPNLHEEIRVYGRSHERLKSLENTLKKNGERPWMKTKPWWPENQGRALHESVVEMPFYLLFHPSWQESPIFKLFTAIHLGQWV